jgi:pectate lyase
MNANNGESLMKLLIVALSVFIMAASPATQSDSTASKPTTSRSRDRGRFPKDGFAKKYPAWFKSDEALRFADNCLTWQTPAGGWQKNMDQTAKPRDPNWTAEKFAHSGTFDNSATIPQILFMGRMFKATGLPRFRDSYLRGVDYVLNAQYPNGGWPQYYPDPDGYRVNITFNDGAMINVMTFLRGLADHGDPELIDAPRVERAMDAIRRGVDCILKCQIRVNGQLTGWCAQHDPNTFAPAGARSYELPSISGGEGSEVLSFLMDLPDPSPDVRQAIHSASTWLDRGRITGLREKMVNRNKVMVADPNAPPLWARFYDIQTNRPMFSGRDGVPRWDITEIEAGRRNGYGWYTTSPAKVLKKYKNWSRVFPKQPG